MTNTLIYLIDFVIFITLVGWVAYGIRKDVVWYNERQKQKQLSLEEKR